MHQLQAEGVQGSEILARMVGHLPDLQHIWTTTSDTQLADLILEHPLFHLYAKMMEDAAEAEALKAKTSYQDLPELPDSLKKLLAALLTQGTAIETGLQAVLDDFENPDTDSRISGLGAFLGSWARDYAKFREAIQSSAVPEGSRSIILPVLEGMGQRIGRLGERVDRRMPA